MGKYVLVGLGGAVGSIARFWCVLGVTQIFGLAFPWGTMLVNVVGSFIIGFFGGFSGAGGRVMISPRTRLLVMVGACGGFTTFSSFSLETLTLIESGHGMAALGNVALSLTLGMGAVWGGFVMAAVLDR